MKEGLSNRLYFDVTSKSLNKKNEELCGDKVEVVRTGDDVIVVLSDGLGSGVKANILATLTSKIIATMMKSGATLEDTVDTIVHTLPVCKVRHMAYSTFSILKLTADGKAYLTEFDCPGCVWVHEGVVLPVDYTTREVGGKTIREASFDLSVGDMFLMFSDGVIYAGLGELMNLGWDWENVCDFVQDNCGKENTSARMTAALLGACEDLYMKRPGTTPPSPPSRPCPSRSSACSPARPASRRMTSGRWWISCRPRASSWSAAAAAPIWWPGCWAGRSPPT